MPFDLQAPLRGNNLGELLQKQQDTNLDRQVKQAQIQASLQKDQGLDKLAETAAYKAAAGLPLTPGDNAAIGAYSSLKGGQTMFDPNTGQIIEKPDLMTNLRNNGYLGGQSSANRTNTIGSLINPSSDDQNITLPHDLDNMNASFNNPGSQGTMPPPANIGSQSMSNIPTMDMLRSRAMPQVQIQGPLAGTPKAQLIEAQQNAELQKSQAENMIKPLDQNQGNAALFADRMSKADPIINQLSAVQTDPAQTLKGSIPLVGNYLVSPEYQKADQAQRDFLNATLRKESGAAISPSEFENARKQYFPQPGDSAAVIAQKAANRQTAIQGIGRQAGPQYQQPQPDKQPQAVDYKSKYGLD